MLGLLDLIVSLLLEVALPGLVEQISFVRERG